MDSALWNTLKCLCCAHGWCYAIFWRFPPPNSLLLTMEEAYYEGPLGHEIASILPQLRFLGEGIVGQVAFTGKPRWMLSDDCEHDSELLQQFSSGIKTIAVISVRPWGVVQFGSRHKILESGEFLEQTQRLLMGTENVVDMADASPWGFENYDLNGLLDSENLLSWALNSGEDDNSKEPSVDNSFPWIHEEGIMGLHGESSCVSDQFTTDRAGFDVFLKPNSTWSGEGEVFSLASSGAQDVTPEDSALTSLCNMNRGGTLTFQSNVNFPESLRMVWEEDFSELCCVDYVSQWFSALDNSLLQSIEFNPSCRGDPLKKTLCDERQTCSLMYTASSECISELTDTTKKRLFSELGIEELLNGGSSFGDQVSTNKRRRTEYSPVNTNPMSMDHSHKTEESTKVARKRARPRESTRPRPKDRQQIQDRIKELRGIIPIGGKCSIDSLLDRTIKYMLFLQSVTKYADKLQEPKSPKLIDEANGVDAKDKTVGKSDMEDDNGVTCAFEVADQTLICPIIVEDMNPPGQMLIEILCEEKGLFLEIAEIIRGFGLNILKGTMEIRENKLWGRFIVEGTRHVTRIEVFWYLMQLLQQTETSGMDNYRKIDMGVPMAMT